MSSNNNLIDVNGKVVIVTGANRGNGLAISEGLAEPKLLGSARNLIKP